MEDSVRLLELLEAAKKDNVELAKVIEQALHVLERAIALYGLNRLIISFNGGKDCTAVLHLLRMAVARHNESHGEDEALSMSDLKLLFFDSDDLFPELREFTLELVDRYKLQMQTFNCSYKEGLENLVEKYGLLAVVMGVRKGDPSSETLDHFSPSSPGWPPFMRVNPVLDWRYKHVWQFLRGCQLEYCKLYDDGYTSVGSTHTTVRNPSLLRISSSGDKFYAPAYELGDCERERVSRNDSEASAQE